LEGEERESRWKLGGQLGVVLASCGGAGGGEAGNGSDWWLERWEERGREKTVETGQRGWFLADFRPAFLLPQTMKSTFIYRRWKREILSTLGKTFNP